MSISADQSVSSVATRRRMARKIPLTIVIVGSPGTGKTSLVDALAGYRVSAHKTRDTVVHSVGKSNELRITQHKLDASLESEIQATVLDVHNFGVASDCMMDIDNLTQFLEDKLDEMVAEQSRIRRNPRFVDRRVHAAIYLLDCSHGLREVDVSAMTRLSTLTNVIPVIGRAESYSTDELKAIKRKIREDCKHYKIPVFEFDKDFGLELPLHVTRTNEFDADGNALLSLKLPFGRVDATDPAVSDFNALKASVFDMYAYDLIDHAVDVLYEQYRTIRLSDPTARYSVLEPDVLAGHASRLKQEKIEREARELKEQEDRVQRELDQRKQLLADRERELRRLEERLAQEKAAALKAERELQERETAQKAAEVDRQNVEREKKQTEAAEREAKLAEERVASSQAQVAKARAEAHRSSIEIANGPLQNSIKQAASSKEPPMDRAPTQPAPTQRAPPVPQEKELSEKNDTNPDAAISSGQHPASQTPTQLSSPFLSQRPLDTVSEEAGGHSRQLNRDSVPSSPPPPVPTTKSSRNSWNPAAAGVAGVAGVAGLAGNHDSYYSTNSSEYGDDEFITVKPRRSGPPPMPPTPSSVPPIPNTSSPQSSASGSGPTAGSSYKEGNTASGVSRGPVTPLKTSGTPRGNAKTGPPIETQPARQSNWTTAAESPQSPKSPSMQSLSRQKSFLSRDNRENSSPRTPSGSKPGKKMSVASISAAASAAASAVSSRLKSRPSQNSLKNQSQSAPSPKETLNQSYASPSEASELGPQKSFVYSPIQKEEPRWQPQPKSPSSGPPSASAYRSAASSTPAVPEPVDSPPAPPETKPLMPLDTMPGAFPKRDVSESTLSMVSAADGPGSSPRHSVQRKTSNHSVSSFGTEISQDSPSLPPKSPNRPASFVSLDKTVSSSSLTRSNSSKGNSKLPYVPSVPNIPASPK